jgi:16S rRNA (guanine527-N7)-methyltransferase
MHEQMEEILKYFPNLTDTQKYQFEALKGLYEEWNAQINVISRKDIENLYTNHVLHSLAISKMIKFKTGSKICDLGTGGGFPGVPLAIMFPDTEFLLVDSIGKKLLVIDAVAEAIGLNNVKTHHGRVEEIKGKTFDFIITRAVATLDKLIPWCSNKIAKTHKNAIPNGLIALKGSINIKEEIRNAGRGIYSEITPISDYFADPFFVEKCIVYVQL